MFRSFSSDDKYKDDNIDLKESRLNLISNIKNNYEVNTDRTRKRSEQMKRLRSNRESICSSNSDILSNLNIQITKPQIKQEIGNINIQTIILKTNETALKTTEAAENAEEDNEEILMVSDLECSIEQEENFSISNSNKSFIPLSNNLVIKSALREDNHTESYILALGLENKEKDDKEENSILEIEKGISDSLEKIEKTAKKENKHVRLPSVNNFLIIGN